MKKLALLLLLPCSLLAQKPQELKIKGKIPANKPVERVIITYRNGETLVNDTIKIAGSEYKYKGFINEPVLGTISFESKETLHYAGQTALKNFNMPVFLESGTIEIMLADSIKESTAKGTRATMDYRQLAASLKPFNEQVKAVNAAYSVANRNKDTAETARLELVFDSLDQAMKSQVYLPFINNHLNSPVGLYALRQYAGYDMDAEKVDPLFTKLSETNRNSFTGKNFAKQLDIAKKTGIGKLAMDFVQNDTLGNPVSLSSLRGKYVLVDFWASWCGPCRRENPNVVKVFNQYKDRNFTVLGVSLDRPNGKEKWIKAIHDDNLTWTHVSDLQFWDNAVAKQYGIQSIPQNFLVDPKGKIIGKNLRGAELEKKIAELLAGG